MPPLEVSEPDRGRFGDRSGVTGVFGEVRLSLRDRDEPLDCLELPVDMPRIPFGVA